MIQLHFESDHNEFKPGEVLRGKLAWDISAARSELELRLLWFTSGSGSSDLQVVEARPIAIQQTSGTDFKFVLPYSPYSFSGKLLSLVWAIEVVCGDEQTVVRKEFFLSPTGREILLGETQPSVFSGAKGKPALFRLGTSPRRGV